ncbi:hypothetical protein C9374_007503 [Naegleria lovaniensis]|uniref:Zn(2)-C6 fungal-type domain-containing protein n=1 Tax=Naegleria lovaniensis TaxID=51637 RepID=A0AA88KLW2_NAELO|nr:uncharacterized protein C9374_007503 [Naegleria lovaniensis]KAG2379364.1 hypothetical protein C9374_007503 [Naegleria lovaniensis]
MSEESIQQSSQHSQQQQPVPPSAVSSSTTSKTNRNNNNNNSNSHGAFSTRTTSANNTMEQYSDWVMMQLNSKSQKPPSLSSQAMMMRTMRLSGHAPTQQPQQLVGESKEGVSRTTTCNLNTNNYSIHMNNIMMNMPNMTSAGSNSGVYRPLDSHASSHEQQEIHDDHALKHHESLLQLLTTNPIMKQQVAHSERRNQNNLFVQQPQLARHPHQVSLTSSPPTHPTPETKSETGVRPFQVATPSHAFFSSSPIPTRLLLLQQQQQPSSSSQSTYSYQVPAMSEQQQAAPKETNSSLQVASFSSTALYNMINPNTIENNNSGLHPQERLFFGEPSIVNILSCETSHAGNSINNTSTTRACESSAHHPHAEAVDMPNTTMHVAQQQPASLSSMQQQPTPQVATPLSAITTSMYGIHALEKTSSPTTCMTDERSPSLPTSSNTSLKMSEATSTSSTSNTTSTTSATFTPTLMNNACIFCKLNHKKCDKVAYPPGCSNCVKSQKQCVYSQARKRGPKTSQPPIHPITGAVQYQFIDHTLSNTVGSSNKRKSKTTNASTGKQAHATTTSSSSSDSLQNNAVSGTSTVVVMAEPSHSSSSSPSPALLCESNSAHSTTATTNMTATTSASATNSAAMRYFTERSYLNNLELVELERKLFSNISESIYRKMALSLIPPCKDSAFLKYWISVSISGQKSNITDSDIRNIDLSQPLGNSHLAILFLIHALVFSRVGRKNHSKAMYEKAREYLSRCFDQIGDVLCAYSLMSYYMLGIIDCSKTLKPEHGSASGSEISLCKKEELEMQPTIMMIHPPQSSVSSSLTSLSSFPSSATTTTTPTSLNPSGNETCMGQCLLRAKYFHYMCETFLNAIMIEDDGKEQACSVHAHGITTASSTIGNNQTPVTVSAPHMQQATREYIQQGLAMTRAFFIPENLDSHIRNVLNSPQNKINYPFMDLVDESSYLEFQILQHVNILNGVVRNIARRHIMRGDGIENSQNGIPKTISTSSISTKSGNATSYLQGTQTIAESITPPLQSVPQSSPIENRPIIQLDTHDSTDLLVQKLDILIKYLKHVVGEEHCFHIILQSLGLKALILFRHRKFVDSTLSLQLMSVVNEITNMTKDNQFKFANINAVFPVEIATKIHCDALHGLVIESSINLMLEYVENLYQQLSQDYMNLLLICEKASLLKFRYSHLLEHAHVCMESYERLKRTNPERFISSAAFVSKR